VYRSFAILLLLLPARAADSLDAVRAEPNLERRSDEALEVASQEAERARKAYTANDAKAYKEALATVREASELSYKSLQETGKPARKRPKYYKRAEQKLRALLKKLDGLEQEVAVDDRAGVEQLKKAINDLHDNILTDIMTKKK
jgi:hypothetical protein